VDRLTNCWECGILLGVCKGVNVIIKQVINSLVDSKVAASQFVLFLNNVSFNHVTRMCALFLVYYPQPSGRVSLPGQPVTNK